MYKNIILDRDGIINEVVFRDGIVSSPWGINEFKFLDESQNFLSELSKSGKKLFVASNQPDIKRKNLPLQELEKMNELIKLRYKIIEIFICPHDDNDNCTCRKPLPGMLNSILKKYNLKHTQTCMIGDSKKDVEAAYNAKIDSFFYDTSYNKLNVDKHANASIFKSFNELQCLL